MKTNLYKVLKDKTNNSLLGKSLKDLKDIFINNGNINSPYSLLMFFLVDP